MTSAEDWELCLQCGRNLADVDSPGFCSTECKEEHQRRVSAALAVVMLRPMTAWLARPIPSLRRGDRHGA